jgi:tRNA(Ile)-lysidine synthase
VVADDRAPAGLEAAAGGLPASGRILVALSGGPDSTALLLWLREAGREVAAAHYDHALRPGSKADAEHVTRLCRTLGVELFSERRVRPPARGSLQAAARELRYEFLGRALRESGRDLVALGHTADDLVEGVILHLLRGSGLAGARGMPSRRGPYLRPLLAVWRSELAAFLKRRGIETLDDPANRDSRRFARAHVRHELLPRLEEDAPGFKRRVWAAAMAAARYQDEVERQASGLGGDRRAFQDADRIVRLEGYRRLYGHQPALNRRQLAAMDSLTVAGRTGSGLDLPGGLRFRVGRRLLEVVAPTPLEPLRPVIRSSPCAGCRQHPSLLAEAGWEGVGSAWREEAFRAVHLRSGLSLELGPRVPGLRMRPLGAPGSRKLQDILTDAHVPRHLREQLPLVFAGGRLVWVPGIAVEAEAATRPGEPGQHAWLELR